MPTVRIPRYQSEQRGDLCVSASAWCCSPPGRAWYSSEQDLRSSRSLCHCYWRWNTNSSPKQKPVVGAEPQPGVINNIHLAHIEHALSSPIFWLRIPWSKPLTPDDITRELCANEGSGWSPVIRGRTQKTRPTLISPNINCPGWEDHQLVQWEFLHLHWTGRQAPGTLTSSPTPRPGQASQSARINFSLPGCSLIRLKVERKFLKIEKLPSSILK